MAGSARLPVILAAAAAVMSLWLSAGAEEFCVAPVTPSCARLDETYDEEVATGRCLEELEAFVADSEAYAVCLSDQADAAPALARAEIGYFKCRQDGRSDCD
jgi:hypothetical protein